MSDEHQMDVGVCTGLLLFTRVYLHYVRVYCVTDRQTISTFS